MQQGQESPRKNDGSIIASYSVIVFPVITMHAAHVLLCSVLILSTIERVKCEYTTPDTVKETYVGTLEKSIRTLIRSQRGIQRKIQTIKEGFTGLMPTSFALAKNSSRKYNTTISRIFNPIKSRIKAIMPGTYWCGDGNISPNESDLGLFEKTDACCRAHDLCPDFIPAEEERDGLLNNGIFTRSSCECDTAFYECLKDAANIVASKIGTTYFNILRPQCFQTYYPIQGCRKYSGRRLINDKCEQYIYNVSLPDAMQWFDNPDF